MELVKRKHISDEELVAGLKEHIKKTVESFWQLNKSIGIIPQGPKDYHSFVQEVREWIEELSRMDDYEKLEEEEYFGCSFEEFVDSVKMSYEGLLFYHNYFIPLSSATLYLDFTDLEKLNDIREELLDRPIPEIPKWDEVFENLLILPSITLDYFIAQIDCKNDVKEELKRALTEKDSASFQKCVSQMGKESNILKNVADYYKVVLDKGFGSLGGGENVNQKSIVSFFLSQYEEGIKFINDAIEHTDLHVIPKASVELMKGYLGTRKIYLNERDYYCKEIQEIVDPYVVDPEETDLYNHLLNYGYRFNVKMDEEGFPEVEVINVRQQQEVEETSTRADDAVGYSDHVRDSGISSNLIKDTTKEHKEWYIEIRESKMNLVSTTATKDKNSILYKCLENLYMELKDTVTCEKDLFIYRFSGLYQNMPFSPENKIQWNGSNIYLGYIIRCLTSDKINYPERMSLYASFFQSKTGKNINFGTAKHIEVVNFDGEKNHLKKSFVKAVELLRRCGFVNVEYTSKR